METMTATSQKFYAVADTFVSVARHGSRWGCYMELEDGTMSWIGEWSPTKAAAVAYAQQQYPLPAKLVADALFARQAARDARKIQEDYYTAPGFNHARYAELVDAKKLADSEWQRAMDRVDANSEATDLYQEAVNPPPTPTPGAPLAAPTVITVLNDAGEPCHVRVTLAGFLDWDNGPISSATLALAAAQLQGTTPDPQTPAARATVLPPYNPEDGAPCAQCGHGQDLHYEGVGECWESSDTTPPVGCPCPQFQAREAAQRADEAAWLPMAGGSDTCEQCGAPVQPGAVQCFPCSATQAVQHLATRCSRCGHAETEHTPSCTRPSAGRARSDLATYQHCPCHAFVVWPDEDVRRERLHQQQAAAVLAAKGLPPMAGGSEEDDEADHYYCPNPIRTCPCPCHTTAWTGNPNRHHCPREGTPEDDAARWLANRGLPPMAGGSVDADGWHRADCHRARQCDRCGNWPQWGWWRNGTVICNACHGDAPDALTRYDRTPPVHLTEFPSPPQPGCRCIACIAPAPMAGGAPTCFYCAHHGHGPVPATQRVTFTDQGAPRSEWVCDDCARIYNPDTQRPLPPMAGGSEPCAAPFPIIPTCHQCHRPADDLDGLPMLATHYTDGPIAYTCFPCWLPKLEAQTFASCQDCGGRANIAIRQYYPDVDFGPIRCWDCEWAEVARQEAAEALAAKGLPPIMGGAPTPADEPAGPGATHTPGPWAFGPYGAIGYDVIGGSQSVAVVNRCAEHYNRALAKNPRRQEPGTPQPYPATPEALANARLIAAAPELLRACQQATQQLQGAAAWLRGADQAMVAKGCVDVAEAIQAVIVQATEHTHPCPTCHQARPCTGTGCADGPRECSTCSQCRGW